MRIIGGAIIAAVALAAAVGAQGAAMLECDGLVTVKPWRILMLGDSIMQDTFHSQFHALVKRAYPKSDVTWLVSVRGSTGCWYYCKPENFKKYVADYKPDCVFIGGISGWIHPEMPLNGGPAIESVARRVNEELGAEVVQLYVAAKNPKVDRPVKELKGFEKVFLKKGGTKTVEFRITPRDLAYWDAFASCFRADAGEYALLVGSSSSDIRDSADIVLEEGREFK